jgi:hypothetical protein
MTKEERYQQFRDDMSNWEVEDYEGRNSYKGPAVIVPRDNLQDIIRETDLELQWDQMGKNDLVIYPV